MTTAILAGRREARGVCNLIDDKHSRLHTPKVPRHWRVHGARRDPHAEARSARRLSPTAPRSPRLRVSQIPYFARESISLRATATAFAKLVGRATPFPA